MLSFQSACNWISSKKVISVMYLTENNDLLQYQDRMILSTTLIISFRTFLSATLTQAVPNKTHTHKYYRDVCALWTISCSHGHSLKPHTHTNKQRKYGREHQINPSLSNPLTSVIKDAHSLLCEGLSFNLKYLNAVQLLPRLGFRARGSPSGVLATAQTQLSLPTD